MTVREYLLSIGASESQSIESGYRTEFTIYDENIEHAVSFMSNTTFGDTDEYFDVYFFGRDYESITNRKYAHVFSRMRITTIEEVRFILEHFV